MSAYQDVAGELHKDGTRDHELANAANALIITTHATNTHVDLLLKGRSELRQRQSCWSASANAYQLMGK
jgi:hypothetical protein